MTSPLVTSMELRARELTPFFAGVWTQGLERFGSRWAREVDELVRAAYGTDPAGWDGPLTAYAEFAMDSLRSQKLFESSQIYENQALSDVSGLLDDEEFMCRNYLPGLLLSHFLWPHHYELLTFFRDKVLAALPFKPGLFYDLGTGTGLYSAETLKFFPLAQGHGVDLSRHSARFTNALVGSFGAGSRYSMHTANIFEWTPPRTAGADFVINQEVLEHLEDPAAFLRALHGFLRPGGRAYITAAINAAHPDHIFLFRSPEEVQIMIEGAGFKVLERRDAYAYEGKPKHVTPCVTGFYCAREGL